MQEAKRRSCVCVLVVSLQEAAVNQELSILNNTIIEVSLVCVAVFLKKDLNEIERHTLIRPCLLGEARTPAEPCSRAELPGTGVVAGDPSNPGNWEVGSGLLLGDRTHRSAESGYCRQGALSAG